MTATVHDLISARSRRGRDPLHFTDDVEALEWITRQIDDIRAETDGQLLTAVQSLDVRLAQLRAVAGAVGDLYRHDQKDTR